MKNNKGFTLIELLAVLSLITVITLITIPTIRYASKKINEKNYEAKLKLIKAAAEEYGEDIKEIIAASPNPNNYQITVRELINNGYLIKDSGLEEDDILDPRNTNKSLICKHIKLSIHNKNVDADLSSFDLEDCENEN